MVWTIAKKEARELLRDGRLRWTCALLVAVMTVGLSVGWRHYAQTVASREAAARLQRAEWLDKGDMHPHMAAHYGTFLFKPAPPLSALDTGVDGHVGTLVFLEAHKQNGFSGRPSFDTPSDGVMGLTTVAVALQILVPLVIVMLTFPAYSGEREQQTLQLVLSMGVRPTDLLLGKIMGLGLPLACVLVPAAVLGGLAMILFAGAQVMAITWARLAVWTLAYGVAFAIVAAVGLTVSMAARSSRSALVMLLALWLVNVVVAPRLAMDVAGRLYATPEPGALETAIERDMAQMVPFEERVQRITRRLVRERGIAGPEQLTVDARGLALAEGEEESAAIYRRHVARLFDTYARQDRVSALLSLAAPALALDRLSMALAGTDLAHHRRFADAVEAYRLSFVQQLNHAIAVNDRIAQQPGDPTLYARYLAGRELWERLPPFTYDPPSVGWALRHAWLSAIALAVWSAVSIGAMLAAVRRLRPV